MDIDYLLFLQGLRNDWGGETIFLLVSALSKSPLTAAIPAVLFWCLNKQAGIFLLANGTCGHVISDLLKGMFCVYRPWVGNAALVPSAEAMAKASSFSFPSGHTQFTTAIYGGFAFFFRRKLPLVLMFICAAIILLVAFSRNFLGVHTPQDVLVAIIYSVALFYAVEKVFAWIGKDEERRLVVLLGGLAVTLAIFMFLYFRPYPEDFVGGKVIVDPLVARADAFDELGFGLSFFLGWFMEHKLINFKTNVSAKDRLWRIIIGFAVLGVITVVVYPLLKSYASLETYNFFKGFLPFFSMLFIIPLIFTQVERHVKNFTRR